MEKYLFEERHDNELNGSQKLYRFDNGFGASVVRNRYSYGGSQGLWELAVITWKGEKYHLCYDTPITDDVLGYLTWGQVEETLSKIKELDAPCKMAA